jgi:hypothetical protein
MRHSLSGRNMPETSAYYHVAYTVALSIYALYGISLYLRRKRLRGK